MAFVMTDIHRMFQARMARIAPIWPSMGKTHRL